MILDEKNRKNLIFLILQFFHEEGYEESLHLLEQDSTIFFNFSYFSNAILSGNWKDAESYLSAFTSPDENTFSRNMFLDLFKWKFSEASDRGHGSEAWNTLSKDIRRIPILKDDGFSDMVEVIAVEDISIAEETCCVDKELVRAKLCTDLHELAASNPSLCDKLDFPRVNQFALVSLISFICRNRSGGMEGLKEDLIWLILQFLCEEKYKNTWHKLEQETKVFFNLDYLVEVMTLGELDKAEGYLADFTGKHENKYSEAMFLEIQKLKCLESTKWEVTTLSGSPDNMSLKKKLHVSVAMLAKKNPALQDKLKLPSMEKSRLLRLMKQSVDWWIPHNVKNLRSLENIPVVAYLCGTPSSPLRKKFNKTVSRRKVFNCKLREITDPSECNALVLPDYFSEEKIACLTYSTSGDYILALAEDGTHKLWTWSSSQNEFCKDTPLILRENVFPKPRLHQPESGNTMRNEIATCVQNLTSCFAIKGSHLFSTSGGKIAVFDLMSFKKVAAFGSPAPMATYFIFIPGDLLAVGLDDGSIFIHCLLSRKVKEKLEGHDHRITCLAFSHFFNALVSSGADGKLCVWSTKSWANIAKNKPTLKICSRHTHESSSVVTNIQFDPYQIELLVVGEGWIGVYEARTLGCLMQWVPDVSDASITSATYSSDGEMIYVGFRSGSIKVLDSKTLVTICRINLTAISQPIPSNRLEVYPTVVVAHPSHLSQISVGLNNGKVIVLQPLEGRGWAEEARHEENEDHSDDSDHCY